MKKICMLTTNPVDFDGRILHEAEALSQSFQVTILARAGRPNPALKNTLFKIKRSKFSAGLPYQLSVLIAMARLARDAFRENPDFFHAHDLPGLLCLWPAALIKKKPLIYDSHELWAGHFNFQNTRGLHWLFPVLEKWLMAKVAKGITVNDSLAEILTQKYHKEFLTIHNYYQPSKKTQTSLDLRKQFPGEIICLHLGSTGVGRGIEQMIRAAKLLPTGFIIILLGADKRIELIQEKIKQEGLEDKVILLPPVAPDEVITVAVGADMGLVLTQNISQSYYLSSPNKLYQYMMAETPVLGSDFPEYKKIILKNNIGLVANPAQPKAIAKAIQEMAKTQNQKKYRANLKGLAKTKYNWAHESKKLLKFYKDIAS